MPKTSLIRKKLPKLEKFMQEEAENYRSKHKHAMDEYRSRLEKHTDELAKFRENMQAIGETISSVIKESALIAVISPEAAAEQAEEKVITGKSSLGSGGGHR